MKNKFLLGVVALAAASCWGGKAADLLTTADNKWAAFKTASKPVLDSQDDADLKIKALKAAIIDLDNTEYTSNELDNKGHTLVKALKAAEAQLNEIKGGLYDEIDTAWQEYVAAANAYVNSLPGQGNK